MPLVPHIVLAPDTPNWARLVITGILFAQALLMLAGSVILWRKSK